MSCLPGMPCYNSPVVKIVYAPGCDPTPVPIISSQQVHYEGPNLSCTGVQNGDCLNTVLEKIDTKICSEELVASIIQTIANNDVLKAYFCQLVASCSPTTTTTTTTIPTCNAIVITDVEINTMFDELSINYTSSGLPCTNLFLEVSEDNITWPISVTASCINPFTISPIPTVTTYYRFTTLCSDSESGYAYYTFVPTTTTTTTLV